MLSDALVPSAFWPVSCLVTYPNPRNSCSCQIVAASISYLGGRRHGWLQSDQRTYLFVWLGTCHENALYLSLSAVTELLLVSWDWLPSLAQFVKGLWQMNFIFVNRVIVAFVASFHASVNSNIIGEAQAWCTIWLEIGSWVHVWVSGAIYEAITCCINLLATVKLNQRKAI